MDKAAARAAHDLMLKRIEEGLKEEDRSNAMMWRGKSDAECARAMSNLSDFGDTMVRNRGFPIQYDSERFPILPTR